MKGHDTCQINYDSPFNFSIYVHHLNTSFKLVIYIYTTRWQPLNGSQNMKEFEGCFVRHKKKNKTRKKRRSKEEREEEK